MCACGGNTPQQVIEMKLYPNGPKESNGLEGKMEEYENGRVGLVSDPWMELYLPEKSEANGQCVVICPGGAYIRLAADHEGDMFARWFNEQGIAAAVLYYRMPNGHRHIPQEDVLTAIEMVREGAAEWNIDPNKVGVMGFSAGGHLAATAVTKFTSAKNRPDFGILIYPVISMKDGVTHEGSRWNLLGQEWPLHSEAWSLENCVSEQTPTCFIALSDNDGAVPPANSLLFYNALKERGVAAEMHIYPQGGHGWGFNGEEFAPHHDNFLDNLARWLKQMGN